MTVLGGYGEWRDTCDTLHAHTQLLGKLAAALAPPEPGYGHVALRLTARGWETLPLPAPDGSGAIVVAIDLLAHEAVVEHSGARVRRVSLLTGAPVGVTTRAVLGHVRDLAGDPAAAGLDLVPAEVPWTVPLDEDTEHVEYDATAVGVYFAAATEAALALAAFRAPYGGFAGPLQAWWGSFDVAVTVRAADAAAEGRELSVGWWPGDPKHDGPAYYAYASPAPDGLAAAPISPAAAGWSEALGEFVLEAAELRTPADALTFARAVASAAGVHPLAAE